MGNVFVMDPPSQTVWFTSKIKKRYYDYSITLCDIQNPDSGYNRDADPSFDSSYSDPTPGNLEDPVLWEEYDFYTTKFSLGVFDS